jgi:hypothetical protein
MKYYYKESRSRELSYKEYKKERLKEGHTLRRKCLLKQIIDG